MSAQVWQYRRPACVLDLFLYEDEGAGQKVVYYEVRPLRHDASSLSDTAKRGLLCRAAFKRQSRLKESLSVRGSEPAVHASTGAPDYRRAAIRGRLVDPGRVHFVIVVCSRQ